ILCDYIQNKQHTVSLYGEQSLRKAHVHENARARVIDAGQYHGVKKLPCLVGGFPVEQLRPEKTVFVGDPVFHSPKNAPTIANMTIILFGDTNSSIEEFFRRKGALFTFCSSTCDVRRGRERCCVHL